MFSEEQWWCDLSWRMDIVGQEVDSELINQTNDTLVCPLPTITYPCLTVKSGSRVSLPTLYQHIIIHEYHIHIRCTF